MIKKKILIALQFFRRGGVELVAINFARNLDRNKYEITFLLVGIDECHDVKLEKEIEDEGFNVVKLSSRGYFNRYKEILGIMKKERFDIVHSHVMFFSGLVAMAARCAGIKKRVTHSHVTKWNNKENLYFKVYKLIMRFVINRFASDKLACSKQAGIFLYGKRGITKNFFVLPNGIDINKFEFNEKFRKEIRKEFDIFEQEVLIGHIGTIYYIKNQEFIVKLLAEMRKTNKNIKLILVGEKADCSAVDKAIADTHMKNFVYLTGSRNDVYKFYSAFDIMIFPSHFEALPVSLIEAQAAQLPCLVSDTVTKDCKFNENFKFLSLKSDLTIWKKELEELIKTDRKKISMDFLKENYDIANVIKKLNEIYLN